MLAAFLIAVVAVGIAWPYLSKQRALPWRSSQATGGSAAAAGWTTEPAVVNNNGPAVHDELCPQCGKVNVAGVRKCIDCGGMMLTDGMSALIKNSDREELIREGLQAGLLLIAMIIAMAVASWLPTAGKLAVVIVTVAVLAYRVLHAISD